MRKKREMKKRRRWGGLGKKRGEEGVGLKTKKDRCEGKVLSSFNKVKRSFETKSFQTQINLGCYTTLGPNQVQSSLGD